MLITAITLSVSAQRWSNAPGDNTGRQLTFADKTVTITGHDSITPGASYTYYNFSTLTSADTILIRQHSAKKYDKVILNFLCDTLTAGRVVTIVAAGTGGYNKAWTTSSGNTMTVKKSKHAQWVFEFNGTYWGEVSRAIEY